MQFKFICYLKGKIFAFLLTVITPLKPHLYLCLSVISTRIYKDSGNNFRIWVSVAKVIQLQCAALWDMQRVNTLTQIYEYNKWKAQIGVRLSLDSTISLKCSGSGVIIKKLKTILNAKSHTEMPCLHYSLTYPWKDSAFVLVQFIYIHPV